MNKTKTFFGIAASILAILLGACGVDMVKGSGNIIQETREVSNFSEIEFEGFGKLMITQGDQEGLSIETDDNLMEYIQTRVYGRTLRIQFTNNKNLVPSESITFYINLKILTTIDSSGAGSLEMNNLNADSLEIVSNGAARIRIGSLLAKDLSIVSSGGGDVELVGKVDIQNIEMSGVGNYTAPNLESRETIISINGIGNAIIWAEERLEVEIQGRGDVSYFGNPEVDYKDSGFGDLKRLGDK